jgi:hypothetical protein
MDADDSIRLSVECRCCRRLSFASFAAPPLRLRRLHTCTCCRPWKPSLSSSSLLGDRSTGDGVLEVISAGLYRVTGIHSKEALNTSMIKSHRHPFQRGAQHFNDQEPPTSIPKRRATRYLKDSSDFIVTTGNNCPSLLCSSVATGVDDVIFLPLLLTSRAECRRSRPSLLYRMVIIAMDQHRPVATVKWVWLLCLFVVVDPPHEHRPWCSPFANAALPKINSPAAPAL